MSFPATCFAPFLPPNSSRSGSERPADPPEGNWIQTDPGKGWFVLLRLYSPLQPYFDKSWQPSEIEAV